MKVTIEYITMKFGLFTKVPALSLSVEYSDVEKAVIETAGLGDYELFSPNYTARLVEHLRFPILVRDFLRREKHIPYDDLAAARADEVVFREALQNLKNAIEAHSQPHKTKDTFEL